MWYYVIWYGMHWSHFNSPNAPSQDLSPGYILAMRIIKTICPDNQPTGWNLNRFANSPFRSFGIFLHVFCGCVKCMVSSSKLVKMILLCHSWMKAISRGNQYLNRTVQIKLTALHLFFSNLQCHISREGWETKQKFTNGKIIFKHSKI